MVLRPCSPSFCRFTFCHTCFSTSHHHYTPCVSHRNKLHFSSTPGKITFKEIEKEKKNDCIDTQISNEYPHVTVDPFKTISIWTLLECWMWLFALAASGNERYLLVDCNKYDEPLKVEEAETIDMPPPPTEKVCRDHLHERILSIIFNSSEDQEMSPTRRKLAETTQAGSCSPSPLQSQ
ncbi:hypothetical protein Patl1_05739 [Pistacia atlantica]|uniref:Uncharacterized protein n=1 Tax=Pistacia atlantica TaxID=434234 RepID=A0ACC1BVC3_9ROSI|nr:hypothetical protein Patl1_05739 [Pistacia atlantica]